MWFSSPDQVTIIIDGATLVCSLIRPGHNHNPPYTIHAIQVHHCTDHELIDSQIFNYAAVAQKLWDFFEKNNLTNPHISLAFTPHAPEEKLVFTPAKKLAPHEFPFEHQNHTKAYSCWLGPTSKQLHAHYTCNLRWHNLLQYHLLGLIASLNITHVTTSSMALLYALSRTNGLTQPTGPQETVWQYTKRCLNSYTLGEQLTVSDILKNQNKLSDELLTQSLGLFLLGRHGDE